MKVKQLIELLQCENEDAEVHFAYNYGDHWRTVVTKEVCEVEELPVRYSDYHRTTRLVGPDEECDVDDLTMAVVLQ